MVDPVRWYRCARCGWEHEMCAMYQECGDCRIYGQLDIISNADGEEPKSDDLRQALLDGAFL